MGEPIASRQVLDEVERFHQARLACDFVEVDAEVMCEQLQLGGGELPVQHVAQANFQLVDLR